MKSVPAKCAPACGGSARWKAAIGAAALGSACILVTPAIAQPTIPTLETEDASLGSMPASPGRVHPLISLDARNGDYSRGQYDGDSSSLHRIPLHAEVGLAIELHHDAQGDADAFFVLESSNGFHSPGRDETSTPRFLYESNELVALVVRPMEGVSAALSYTNKRSPNGQAGLAHEASVSVAYEGKSRLGELHPTFEVTGVPADGRGGYSQLGVEPEVKLGTAHDAPKLSLPLHFGVGWGGFYGAGSGTVTYGDVGLALSKPLTVSGRRFSVSAQIQALVRDPTLRALDGDMADHAAVVPLGKIGLAAAF